MQISESQGQSRIKNLREIEIKGYRKFTLLHSNHTTKL